MKNRGILLLILGAIMITTVAADPVVTFWIDDGYFTFDNHYERQFWDLMEGPYYFSFSNDEYLSEGYFTFISNVDDGYFRFSSNSHITSLLKGYFTFESERKDTLLMEGNFSFVAKQKPHYEFNLYFIFFVIVVIVAVCSLTYVGILHEKKKRRFL